MSQVSARLNNQLNNLWDTGEDDSWKVYMKWMQGLIVWDELRLLTGPVIELSPALRTVKMPVNTQQPECAIFVQVWPTVGAWVYILPINTYIS